jgi:lipopolysaccharide transport system permease protein
MLDSMLRFFFTLVRRELATRYKGAILGALWPLVSQLVQLLVFTYLFSYLLKVHLEIPGVQDNSLTFGLWLFAGLIPWTAFVAGVLQGASSVIINQNTVKKVVFPLVLLPLVPVAASFIEGLFGLPLLLVFLAVFAKTVHVGCLLIFIAWVPQLLLTAGIAYIAAALTVYIRDIPIALNPALLVAFYLTPIVYPATIVPKALHAFVEFNPMAQIATTYREILLGGALTRPDLWGISVAISAAVFLFGVTLYTRLAPSFADHL